MEGKAGECFFEHQAFDAGRKGWQAFGGQGSHNTVHLVHLVGMQDRLSDLSATPAKSSLPALAFMLTTKNLQIEQSHLDILPLKNPVKIPWL